MLWTHVQKLFSVKEKETLQQSLSKVQLLVFFMGCKDILQIYTNQLESIFWNVSKTTIQSSLWTINVCNLSVKVVPFPLYRFKNWKPNLKGYKLQLCSKKQ